MSAPLLSPRPLRALRRALLVPALLAPALVAAAEPVGTPAPVSAPEPAAAPAPAPVPAPRAAPAPYSIPWQLRPAQPVHVVRSDTSVAFSDPAVQGAPTGSLTTATTLLASYKVLPQLAPMVRLGFVQSSPGGGVAGAALLNPVVGGTYGLKLSEQLRLALFLGVALPLGQGGGNTPEAPTLAATRAGVPARSAMDNAMFAVNDLTVFPGVDLAYVSGGLTVQLEATVLQLTRVRGEAVQADAARTNLTSGLHVGYFLAPWLSLGGELRHQRWLSTPSTVTTPSLRDNTTVAAGPRFHLPLGHGVVARPGLSATLPLDAPMRRAHYAIWQLDVPVLF